MVVPFNNSPAIGFAGRRGGSSSRKARQFQTGSTN
jgi:hypothetical protein